jgi:hypothetical protein
MDIKLINEKLTKDILDTFVLHKINTIFECELIFRKFESFYEYSSPSQIIRRRCVLNIKKRKKNYDIVSINDFDGILHMTILPISVGVETDDTDIHYFSHSSEKLDYTLKTIIVNNIIIINIKMKSTLIAAALPMLLSLANANSICTTNSTCDSYT